MTMRNRTSGRMLSQANPWSQKAFYTDTCGVPPTWRVVASGTGYTHAGTTRRMSDLVIANFHRRRKAGEVFFSDMYSDVRTQGTAVAGGLVVENTSSSCSAPYTHFQRWEAVSVGHILENHIGLTSDFEYKIPLVISDSDIQAAISEASTSCLNKRGRSSSNLYESAAEAHKALGLLDGILGNALKVVSRKTEALARARDAGSAYLAYRYGLKPIMNDIEAVITGLDKKIGRVRSTSRGSVDLDGSSVTATTYNLLGMSDVTVQHNFAERAVIRATVLDEYIATLSSNIGFSDKGLATLPWELFPYSFVVDWFANVGEYIGALAPVFGVNQLGSCVTVERSISYAGRCTKSASISGRTVISPLVGSLSGSRVVKYRYPGVSAPKLMIKSDFRLDSATRALDSLALIVQKLR